MLKEARLLSEAIEDFKRRWPDVPLTFAQSVPFQRPFTERLLMSLIWASPAKKRNDAARKRAFGDKTVSRTDDEEGERTEAQMLWDAYKAIYARAPSASPQDNYDFEKLCRMAQLRDLQRTEKARGDRKRVDSYRKLADHAADTAGGAERLRKAFPKFLEQTANLDPDMLVDLEVVQRLALDLVEAVVTQFGVPFYAYD